MYRKYLALDRDSAEAAGELGEMLATQGDLQDAYFQLDKSLGLDPQQPRLRERLVEVSLSLGRDVDAKRLLLAEPDADLQEDPKRLWLLAKTEESLREYDQARQHFEMAVKNAPDEPDYAKSFADLLVEASSRISNWPSNSSIDSLANFRIVDQLFDSRALVARAGCENCRSQVRRRAVDGGLE